MVLTYIAHACFKLEVGGKIIVFDPYAYKCFGGAVGYERIDERADVVLISHKHEDHGAVSEIDGNPRVISEPGKYEMEGIVISGLKSYHDPQQGAQRGENIVFIVSDGKYSIAHLGDQGFVDLNLVQELKSVDVVLVPVGGTYTLGPKEATEFINKLEGSKLIIPMHYKTPKLSFPIKPVEDFLELNKDKEIVYLKSCRLDVGSIFPVQGKKIIVMDYKK